MAKCDFSSMKDFAKRLNAAANGEQKQKFYEDCCKELAARFLAKVIKRTPVGQGKFEVAGDGAKNTYTWRQELDKKGETVYKARRSKKADKLKLKRLTNGGTLWRGWTAKTEEEAKSGSTPNTMSYLTGLKVQQVGREYRLTITNPVRYASYVEFGHRQTPGRFVPVLGKRLKNGWVKGQFMMTISEKELAEEASGILSKKLDIFLREVMGK